MKDGTKAPNSLDPNRAAFDAWARANGHFSETVDDMLAPLDRSLKALMWAAWQEATARKEGGSGVAQMPRRKREALQRRHDFLRGVPHHRRNTYDEAEIAALDWVLHRTKVTSQEAITS